MRWARTEARTTSAEVTCVFTVPVGSKILNAPALRLEAEPQAGSGKASSASTHSALFDCTLSSLAY